MSTSSPTPRGGIKWFIALAAGSFFAGRALLGLLGIVDVPDAWAQLGIGSVAIALAIAFRVLSQREARREES